MRYLLFVLLSLGSYGAAQSQSIRERLPQQQIHIAAHRGAHNHAPENSLQAIEAAIQLGLTFVELDVRSTKDSVLVILHDETLDRTTTGQGLLSDYTWAEVQQLYLTDTAGKPTLQRVLRFDEALKACKGRIFVDLDFKDEGEAKMRKTCQTIAAMQMQDQVMFFLYNHQDMALLQHIDPKIIPFPRARSYDDLYAIVQTDLTRIVHLDESFTDIAPLQELTEQGYFFWLNTLGLVDQQAQLEGTAPYATFLKTYPFVGIIQTDEPALLHEALQSQ